MKFRGWSPKNHNTPSGSVSRIRKGRSSDSDISPLNATQNSKGVEPVQFPVQSHKTNAKKFPARKLYYQKLQKANRENVKRWHTVMQQGCSGRKGCVEWMHIPGNSDALRSPHASRAVEVELEAQLSKLSGHSYECVLLLIETDALGKQIISCSLSNSYSKCGDLLKHNPHLRDRVVGDKIINCVSGVDGVQCGGLAILKACSHRCKGRKKRWTSRIGGYHTHCSNRLFAAAHKARLWCSGSQWIGTRLQWYRHMPHLLRGPHTSRMGRQYIRKIPCCSSTRFP